MTVKTKDIEVRRGETYTHVIQWELPTIVYKAITGIDTTAPVRVHCVGHDAPNGWNVAITNVKGPTQLNAEANNVKDTDYHPITKIDVDTFDLNDVNAAGYKPYISGGVVQYQQPQDLTGHVFRMSVKDKVGGTELLRLDTTNNGIIVNNTDKTITLKISATASAAFAFKKGVYDVEGESPSGVVTPLLAGVLTVKQEVTTN